MPRRVFDFSADVVKQVWQNAKRIPGRDPDRWRCDVLGRPILRPLRSRFHGLLCYQCDHKIAPKTKKEKLDSFYSSPENAQLLSSSVNRAKSNKKLTKKEELEDHQLAIKPTKGLMDLAEMILWGNITDEDGKVVRKCYTVEQMRTGKLLVVQTPPCSIPTETEMNEDFLKKSEEPDEWENLTKNELRQELGMDVNLHAVLLFGSPRGTVSVRNMLTALDEALFDNELGTPCGQVVIMCCQNKALFIHLSTAEWRIPIKIKWQETDLEKWMGACDCTIPDVADPAIIDEAIKRNLLVVLSKSMLGKGGVPYAPKSELAVYPKSPKESADIIARWFSEMD